VGEEFPTEGTGEAVVFLAHIERGFGVPAGDFFRSLLYFYRIEVVHLVPNAITIIPSFIHLFQGLPRDSTALPLVAALLQAEDDRQI
jgi:hypothetical protein